MAVDGDSRLCVPAAAAGHEGACSQCKITPGRDWTYTIMQPFDNFPK